MVELIHVGKQRRRRVTTTSEYDMFVEKENIMAIPIGGVRRKINTA